LRRDAGHFFLALLVCCVVFVPWQVYITHRWPEEAKYEYEINIRHLTEVLQGHGGSVWYYAENVPDYFGKYLWILIPMGIALAVSSRTTNKRLLVPSLTIITFVFCFFSFAVKTKMDTYVFFVAPLCMIFLAYALAGACRRAGSRWVWAVTFVVSIYLSFAPRRILGYLSAGNKERNRRIATTKILRDLKAALPGDVQVVVNTNAMENLDLMFYANELSAYPSLSRAEVRELFKKNVRIAAFKSDGTRDLPDYVSAYPRLYVIDKGYSFRDVPY
jgi:hypothetical protein